MGSQETVRRRTPRDWAVDIACCVVAAAFSVLTSGDVVSDPSVSPAELAADQVTGAVACAALWLRRRWPVSLSLVLLPVSTVSHFVAGPLLVALFTVAVHRSFQTAAVVGGLAAAAAVAGGVVRPDPGLTYTMSVLIGTVLYGGAIGWGMFVRSRRLLLRSLRERALRAEAEAALRAEHAQRLTRERIAREMHDVLAHRLSLLSVHAGALEYRTDAPPEDVARAASVIRDSAHQALQDLREVIGVLRAPSGEAGAEDGDGAPGAPARPQPTLADLPRLVAESREAGMRVALRGTAADARGVPGSTGRTAYRIVQEGLTNARKHAPGAEVTVTAAGAAGEGLMVEVRNPLPAREAAPSPIPGAGQGLTGLAERAVLAGGRLECGPSEDGEFRLYAWLPWPAY
ncbi:histidine kinase [Streptomyces sp. B1866]|uniref:sensor histidine kinase n=1 Tax=Streptomyces sp. B1866 TaxID=3075431 RepID=UPI00289244F9|nr:histidine kinase [Streptomyces sp. B1866]MDT3396437.1 histidine kinase [Streptomyces sp. B1866]